MPHPEELDDDFADDIDEELVVDNDDGSSTLDLEPRPSRAQRRAARMLQRPEELAESRANAEKIAQLEKEAAQFKAEVHQYADNIDRPTEEPVEDRLLRERDEVSEWYHGLTAEEQAKPDVQERAKKRAVAAERNLTDFRVDQGVQRALQQQRGQGQQNYVAQVIRDEFPDIVGDERFLKYASGQHQMLMAESGKPDSLEMQREAATLARRHFKTRPDVSAPPSEHRKAAYGGHSRGNEAPTGKTFRITESQKTMAQAVRPDLPPKDAWRVWSQRHLKRAEG